MLQALNMHDEVIPDWPCSRPEAVTWAGSSGNWAIYRFSITINKSSQMSGQQTIRGLIYHGTVNEMVYTTHFNEHQLANFNSKLG